MVEQTVMVVGVSTFKGFHLARRLLKEGFDVVGIDDEGKYKTQIAKQRLYVLTHPRFHLVRTSLTQKANMRQVLTTYEPAHILLCAGPSKAYDGHLMERYERMKRYVSRQSKRVPVNSLITFDLPVEETRQSTSAIHLVTEDVYGPWDDESSIFSKAILAVDGGHRFVGAYASDIVNASHIDDVVESVVRLLRLLQSGVSPIGQYQIEASDYVQVQTLLADIGQLLHRPVRVSLPIRDPMFHEYDLPTLETLTGFHPSTSLYEGLKQVLDWYGAYQTMMKEGMSK
ncbi:NAD-dependent epimerase/dehydratase family protein [Exiguobacterium algae]|uniref:NAD-dependent epimerase/dehydratase family protein n=1 Tax=Exiguobacterium algae TaxID=2751250 RepID=UPI001BEA10F5|nr:NAD-dependent epimerase/dehydratase family protein [Exiguobacterium algae]